MERRLEYRWVNASDVVNEVHKACMMTPEVAPKMGDIQTTLINMKRMDVLGVYVDGNPVGAVLFNGCEFHGAILPSYRGKWMTRDFILIVNAEKKKRGGLFTTVNGASEMVRKSVMRFCAHYDIEVRDV